MSSARCSPHSSAALLPSPAASGWPSKSTHSRQNLSDTVKLLCGSEDFQCSSANHRPTIHTKRTRTERCHLLLLQFMPNSCSCSRIGACALVIPGLVGPPAVDQCTSCGDLNSSKQQRSNFRSSLLFSFLSSTNLFAENKKNGENSGS